MEWLTLLTVAVVSLVIGYLLGCERGYKEVRAQRAMTGRWWAEAQYWKRGCERAVEELNRVGGDVDESEAWKFK